MMRTINEENGLSHSGRILKRITNIGFLILTRKSRIKGLRQKQVGIKFTAISMMQEP